MLVNGGISSSAASPSSSSAVSSAGDVNNFARGDKASASVRLRSKSRKGGNGEANRGALAGERSRLLSRHSGDFGHFNAASKMELVPAGDSGGQPTDNDWAYITYPNGVPTVQEVRELTASEAATVAASEMPKRTPIKVVTRDVPGISLAGLKLSADVNNGGTDSPTSTASSSSSKNRFRGSNGRNSNTPAGVSAVAAKSSEENVRFRRRLSEQPPNVANAASMASASSKRCSGEFQFVRTAKNGLVGEVSDSEQNNKEGGGKGGGGAPKCRTPNRGVAARGPGLGRRAATQVQIERGERKNSYSSAMYKSQDNLVKVRSRRLTNRELVLCP